MVYSLSPSGREAAKGLSPRAAARHRVSTKPVRLCNFFCFFDFRQPQVALFIRMKFSYVSIGMRHMNETHMNETFE